MKMKISRMLCNIIDSSMVYGTTFGQRDKEGYPMVICHYDPGGKQHEPKGRRFR